MRTQNRVINGQARQYKDQAGPRFDQCVLFSAMEDRLLVRSQGFARYDDLNPLRSIIRNFWPSYYLGSDESPLPKNILIFLRMRDAAAIVLFCAMCLWAMFGPSK